MGEGEGGGEKDIVSGQEKAEKSKKGAGSTEGRDNRSPRLVAPSQFFVLTSLNAGDLVFETIYTEGSGASLASK